MKQKKIIVPILTLAVMLLMVGGVYAVFSSTQPEKSKAENVRDTTDQDYEKGLTEEQKAFNELINKQIYEETANNLEQYEQYGLTYNSDENQLFFNGKSVCYFADNRATDGTFEGTEVHSANGDIGIITERDRSRESRHSHRQGYVPFRAKLSSSGNVYRNAFPAERRPLYRYQ